MLTKLLSVVTTRSFKPFKFEGRHKNKLLYNKLDSLGLYVHIPFCKSLCSFCPYSKQIYDKSLASDYKVALLKEIDLVTLNDTEKKQTTSLYFGGGTPSLMMRAMSASVRSGEDIGMYKTQVSITRPRITFAGIPAATTLSDKSE